MPRLLRLNDQDQCSLYLIMSLIFSLGSVPSADAINIRECLTMNLSLSFMIDPNTARIPDWLKKITQLTTFPIRKGLRLTLEPIAFPLKLSHDTLASLYQKGARGLYANKFRLISEGGYAISGTLIWAYLADRSAISIASFHLDTDDEFLPKDPTSPMVVINAFNPENGIMDELRKILVDKMVDDWRKDYPKLRVLHPENPKDLVNLLDEYAKINGPIQRVDWYGHSSKDELLLTRDSIRNNYYIQENWELEKKLDDRKILAEVNESSFGNNPVFRFNSCYANMECNEKENSDWSVSGGENAAEMTARTLTHGRGAAVLGATTQTYPSGLAEALEFASGQHFPTFLARAFDLPFTQFRGIISIYEATRQTPDETNTHIQSGKFLTQSLPVRRSYVSGGPPVPLPSSIPRNNLKRNQYIFVNYEEKIAAPVTVYDLKNEALLRIQNTKGGIYLRLDLDENLETAVKSFINDLRKKTGSRDSEMVYFEFWLGSPSLEALRKVESITEELRGAGNWSHVNNVDLGAPDQAFHFEVLPVFSSGATRLPKPRWWVDNTENRSKNSKLEELPAIRDSRK